MDEPQQDCLQREYGEQIAELRLLPARSQWARKALIDSFPRRFWELLLEGFTSLLDAERATTITTETIRKHLGLLGLDWDHSRVPGDLRQRDALLDALIADMEEVTSPYPIPNLDPDRKKNWGIAADLHCPTTDPVWLTRYLRVCEAEKIDCHFTAGDFGNYDALSRFAIRDRGAMPRLQTEINVLRKMIRVIELSFPDERYFMLTNHEQRLLGTLKGELDGEDLFGCLLKGGKYVDSRICDIGGHRFVHPDRGRKVRSSQPNEFTLVYGMPTWIAHSHRFDAGPAQNGMPCGMLAGLFWKDRIGYYMKGPGYLEWENGFWILKNSRMIPFADCVGTDWSRYEKTQVLIEKVPKGIDSAAGGI